MPGYVASKMCHEMPGPKPFLMSPEKAARIIRAGLERNKARQASITNEILDIVGGAEALKSM